jgi:hypothetical protein
VAVRIGERLLVGGYYPGEAFLVVKVTGVSKDAATVAIVATTPCRDGKRLMIDGDHARRLKVTGLKETPLSSEEVAARIADLGAEEFDVRERATKRLIEAGVSARASVSAARESKDPEVAARARHILARLDFPVERLSDEQIAEIFRAPRD